MAVIMLIRVYAMYQQSRIILILLVFLCSAIIISCVVVTIIQDKNYPIGELEARAKVKENS